MNHKLVPKAINHADLVVEGTVTACLPTSNIYFMHVLEALGSQHPIKGHLADPPGPILSASARTDCSRPDGYVVAASMTTGHHWAFSLYMQLISGGRR